MGRTTLVRRTISRLLVVGILATTTLVGLTGTSWASDRTHAAEEIAFSNKINNARRARGLAPVKVNLQLTGVARDWTDRMAVAGKISHNPQVAAQVQGDWTRLGENVGFSTRTGASTTQLVNRLHTAFMKSAGHRANVVGDYNQVGVGVRVTGDTMWVTVNFAKSRTIVSDRMVKQARTAARRTFAPAGIDGRTAAYAVVTSSDSAALADAGATLAGADAPLLFTHPANDVDASPVLHPLSRSEIDRVLDGEGTVYVVGARRSVSDRAVNELISDGYTVKRLPTASAAETLAAP